MEIGVAMLSASASAEAAAAAAAGFSVFGLYISKGRVVKINIIEGVSDNINENREMLLLSIYI